MCVCGHENCLAGNAPSYGSCLQLAGDGLINFTERIECIKECAKNAKDLSPVCTSVEAISQTPVINCNVNLSQISSQSSKTSQLADSKVDAQMTTNIQNKFESEIDKKINQKNKDLNLMQFNSSRERTALSQSIRNEISNSITNTSKNLSSTYQNSEQNIEFNNAGIINCSGCGEKADVSGKTDLLASTNLNTKVENGRCQLSIDQTNLQAASTDQKASAALSSIFNSDVLNDLSSKYKFDLAQTNEGLNVNLIFIMIICIIIAIAVLFYSFGSTIKELFKHGMWPIASITIVCIFVGLIIFLTLYAKCDIPTLGCGIKKEEKVIITGGAYELNIINGGKNFKNGDILCIVRNKLSLCRITKSNNTINIVTASTLTDYATDQVTTNLNLNNDNTISNTSISEDFTNMLIKVTSVNIEGTITSITIIYPGSGYQVGQKIYINQNINQTAEFEVTKIIKTEEKTPGGQEQTDNNGQTDLVNT